MAHSASLFTHPSLVDTIYILDTSNIIPFIAHDFEGLQPYFCMVPHACAPLIVCIWACVLFGLIVAGA